MPFRSALVSALVLSAATLAAAPAVAHVTLAAGAQARPVATLKVQDGWSRPGASGVPAVGYLTIVNAGARSDHLAAASSPWARGVGLHRSTMRGGIMSMQALPGGLDVPAAGSVKLSPGGEHLMLTGLKRALRAGDRVPVILQFRRAGPVRAELVVRTDAPADAGLHDGMRMR